MEKTDKMEGVGGGMATPKVESKVLPDKPQISRGF
jgi:hypothetical protein